MAYQGKVRFFNPEKGFGFIVPADKTPDIFVHFSGIQLSPGELHFRALNQEETVFYDVMYDDRKDAMTAHNVRGMGDGIPAPGTRHS